MSVIQRLKRLVSGPETGVVLECANCDERIEAKRDQCPKCGSTKLVEKEGFEMQPG